MDATQADVSPSFTNLQKWLITLTVMLAAVIDVLDVTIVNVSLTPMMGSLGASTDQITWVLTSYIVSAAVCMPLTGFLVSRLGRKKLLLLNIIGFGITSMLCGVSTSLMFIVICRTLQGIFGASLIPLSQVILRSIFPKQELGKAMAVWGIGIMSGPVLGPTLGGWITEVLNWRWIFYINIPVCIIAFILSVRLIPETPAKKTAIDWVGLVLMAAGIGSLQLFLDRGNTEGWFQSKFILYTFIFCLIILSAFIVRGWRLGKKNIINLHLFRDYNFSISNALVTTYCMAFFGILAMQPLMMETLLGYPSLLSGLVMAPRGIASAFGMMLVANLINRFDPRFFVSAGVLLTAIGTWFFTKSNLNMDYHLMVHSGIVQGLGMGLFFVQLSVLAFNNLKKEDNDEAAGLFNFWRSLGTSIGISICSTLVTRLSQVSWNDQSGKINLFNHNYQQWVQKQNLLAADPITMKHVSGLVYQQSMMVAFIDTYFVLAIGLFLLCPVIWLLEKPKFKDEVELLH